ncbi:lysis system i-spanin subunit Rz [Stutzerimonas stutzeri]|uniref:lysis system i-spanin subunit Rz n=1 Tax=Stutzerimonas stutzeri TaxID=316 RepID=UPI000D0AE0AF|nr:lysis system i-spanin subunit Rz [Stutzerimonas stutzeri]AWL02247.1 lysis protein [Stutzerimonas stutzeri]
MIALLKQYKLIALAAAVLALMALSATGAWQWQGNAYGKRLADQAQAHETFLRQVAEANAAVILKQQAERLDLESRLAASDQQRYGELRHAQQEIDRLSAAVADGSRRLSVRASCPAAAGGVPEAAGASRLDDGSQRANIHEEDARRIVAITGDADACAVKLAALQEWAREVTKGD